MKRIVMLAWLATAASACAQWPTNWPLNDMDGRDRALCVYSALVERVTAANDGITQPTAPYAFTQRQRLVSYKAKAKTLLDDGYFVDMRRTNAAGRFEGVYTNSSGDPVLPYLTWTSACAYASVNTNYAARTPMFNLGSDTNYGWVPFKALLNEMTATTFDYEGAHSLHDYDTVTKAALTNQFYLLTNDWSILRAAFLAHMNNSNNWSIQSATNQYSYAFSVVHGVLSNGAAALPFLMATENTNSNTRGTLLLRNIATNMNSAADVYVMGDNPGVSPSFMPVTAPPLYTNIWTNAVQEDTSGVIYYFDTIAATNASVRQTRQWPIFGGDVDSDYRLPVNESDWTYPTNGTYSFAIPQQRLGYSQLGLRNATLLRWNVTNGFRYVSSP